MTDCFVYPGQSAFSVQPAKIKTILGSCVSVVFCEEDSNIGGLCHYLLPEPNPGTQPSPRYGSFAIADLLTKLVQAGASRERIRAKVYGGGDIENSLNRLDGALGERNIAFARQELHRLNIPVVEENVGGKQGRLIALDTSNFHVEHSFAEYSAESQNLSGIKIAQVSTRIKVLIVDGSPSIRSLFTKVLAQSEIIEVVGIASDATEAREKIQQLRPDVITLDIEMPKMDSVAFLEKLMLQHPLPVIMVSSQAAEGETAQKCLKLGALEFLQKPAQNDTAILADLGELLINKIIAASTARLTSPKNREAKSRQHAVTDPGSGLVQGLNLIVIGGNVGCSEPLAQIIRGLASDSPPVVVATSTISGFVGTFTHSLQQQSRVELQILRHTETPLRMGRVYFATAENHVQIGRSSKGSIVACIEPGPSSFGQRPSSEKLFNSAAEALPGSCCGILLSGFSADGVTGLLKIREHGGITIVQNPEEAAFNSSPASAIERGAADYILSAGDIPACILQLRNRRVQSVS